MGARVPFTLAHDGHVGVLVNPSGECAPQLLALQAWAGEQGLQVLDLGVVGRRDPAAPALGEDCRLVVALGGDGTILEALRLAAPHGAPVLGVNFGHRGFLAATSREGLGEALRAIAAGDARVEARMALHVEGDAGEPREAYNEAVLARTPGRGSAHVVLEVHGGALLEVVGDGVVLSSPTGSTAYTLSAGGPVVSPHLDAVVLTPLAAQTAPLRSLVLAAGEPLRLRATEGSSPLLLEVDGRVSGEVPPGGGVAVRPADRPGLLLKTGAETFYDDLRTRLLTV
jgi:NAD+ kinase